MIEKVKVILGPSPQVVIGGREVPFVVDAEVDGAEVVIRLRPTFPAMVIGGAASAKVRTKAKDATE